MFAFAKSLANRPLTSTGSRITLILLRCVHCSERSSVDAGLRHIHTVCIGVPMQFPTLRAARAAMTGLTFLLPIAPRLVLAQHATLADPVQSSYVNLTRTGSSGNPWMQAAGETFRTPDAVSVSLTSWSFWLNAYATFDLPAIPVQLEIVNWDGSMPVGRPLFVSTPVTPTDPASEEATFNVGLRLDPFRTYVAMAVPARGLPPIGVDGFLFDDTGRFADGAFVYFETSFDQNTNMYRHLLDDPSINTNLGDSHPEYSKYDATFQATFDAPATTTPEPATITLVITGLAGLAGISRLGAARRRRRRQNRDVRDA